jgi:hypothetical protein
MVTIFTYGERGYRSWNGMLFSSKKALLLNFVTIFTYGERGYRSWNGMLFSSKKALLLNLVYFVIMRYIFPVFEFLTQRIWQPCLTGEVTPQKAKVFTPWNLFWCGIFFSFFPLRYLTPIFCYQGNQRSRWNKSSKWKLMHTLSRVKSSTKISKGYIRNFQKYWRNYLHKQSSNEPNLVTLLATCMNVHSQILAWAINIHVCLDYISTLCKIHTLNMLESCRPQ